MIAAPELSTLHLPVVYLMRFDSTPAAMFGRLEDAEHHQIAVTVERPWLNNAGDVSCIKAGGYRVAMRDSVKHHGQVYGVQNVPDRSNIEIHPANLASQLLGCIALGQSFGHVTLPSGPPWNGETGYGVLNSDLAVEAFVARMNAQPFLLIISDPVSDSQGTSQVAA